MEKSKLKKDLEELKQQTEVKAARRWNERKSFRENPVEYLEKNQDEKAKMEFRYRNYNMRESARAKIDIIKGIEIKASTPERKIGDTLDLSKRPPSNEAYKFGTPVGRIYQIPDPGIEIDAFGTGFLISPNLLMTNYHVLPFKNYAEGCAVNFQYEYNEFNRLQSGIKFKLNPANFFFSHEDLDFAIIYVEPTDETGTNKLSQLGFLPLIATKGKVILNDPINIVQHPLGGPKQYSTDNNFVKDILEKEGFIQYSTDTLESSSGSPAANKHWEVAALHHSGIAMTVGDKVWSKHNKPWDKNTMTDDDKIYIANEGVSISRIIDFIKTKKFSTPQETELINTVLQNSADKVMENNTAGTIILNETTEQNKPNPNTTTMAHNVFNFYNTANVNIYTAGNSAAPAVIIPAETLPKPAAPEKKLRFDESYGNRRYKGYKPNFLGISIPTPQVVNSRLSEIYKKDDVAANDPLVLKYYHYSLVMNKKFRLQMWSAVNVDYDPALKTSRNRDEFGDEGNSWRPDPRIPVEIQITDAEFYKPATQVDRGHMVRRDDSCYGNTELEIEYANSDTFHWTNCTPQHEGFNQSLQWGLWGLLENAVKDGLSGDDTKSSVFAGPVLVEDPDRIYMDIYYPVKFWKVIATIDETEGLLAYGFMLDQTKVIDKRGLEAKFDFTKFKSQQVSLKKIEQEAGIIFPAVLKAADIFIKNGLATDTAIELESKDSIHIQVTKKKKVPVKKKK